MIHFTTGNLLESNAAALVNTVNTMGVMGKGIALQFKQAFPENFRQYAEACKKQEVSVGRMFVTEDKSLQYGEKIIINFPTKTNWRLPSEYSYIESGLIDLIKLIQQRNIPSVAIPPLGSGNGGLDWNRVRKMIITYFAEQNCEVYLYEPSSAIKEVLKKERVKLTPARAMLLSVMYDMVKNGEFVSEFSAEKIAYFLQRFGAGNSFNLDFYPNFYGPYSGKVRHVLYYLNGSYIMEYSAMDKKPFEELGLVMEAEQDVNDFLNQPENEKYKQVVEQTIHFLKGFYSPYGLELLSSIDFIKSELKKETMNEIVQELGNWNDRKKTLFNNATFISQALEHIQAHLN
ncbi:MAG: macro domain-containing protein [Bacteroidia bacterium]